MKPYFLRLFLFTLPLFIYFAVPFFVFYTSGELAPFEDIVKAGSKSEPTLFGLAYTEFERPYKIAALKEKAPELMVLGTSRVLAFKSEFFKPDTHFYNAGRAVDYIPDFLSVLQEIPASSSLKIIIVGLDPHFFDPREETTLKFRRTHYPVSVSERARELIRNQTPTLWGDLFSGKINLDRLFQNSTSTIGMKALLHATGFKNDGSYSYPETTSSQQNISLTPASDGIWEFGNHVAEPALASFEAFLAEAQAREIHIVGFLPPYAEEMQRAIQESKTAAAQTQKEEPRILGELFKKYGFTFFDASSSKSFGSKDEELIDPIHGGPEMYEKLLKHLGKRDPLLKKYIRI